MAQDLITTKEISDTEINRLIDELDNTDLEDTDKMVMKELLRSNEKDIFFKTELSTYQINAIAKLLTINQIVEAQASYVEDKTKGQNAMKSVVVDMTNILMKLQVSKERKGRMEFIEAWKGGKEDTQGKGWVSKFLGKGDGI